MTAAPNIEGLPGESLVRKGLRNLQDGEDSTVEALLVGMAAGRLRECGIPLPDTALNPVDPELRLYVVLREEFGDEAYSRYNSLKARFTSFLDALDGRRSTGSRPRPE